MRQAGENGIAEGLQQSRELLEDTKNLVQGVYLMPSFGRYEVVAELIRWLRGQAIPAARTSGQPRQPLAGTRPRSRKPPQREYQLGLNRAPDGAGEHRHDRTREPARMPVERQLQ